MIPDLPPEILAVIIRQKCTGDDGTVASKRERQKYLANLMSVSKVFNEFCSPQLYEDVMLYNTRSFFDAIYNTRDPKKKTQLEKIKTLRICQSTAVADPAYPDLLLEVAGWTANLGVVVADQAWTACGSLRYPHDPSRSRLQVLAKLAEDTFDLRKTAAYINIYKTLGHDAMKGLERVALQGRMDDAIAQKSEADYLPTAFGDTISGLPSVQYYCQSSIFGPLALTDQIIRMLNPPKIVTLHISRNRPLNGWAAKLPIVIGSTNRYILSCPAIVSTHKASTPADVDDRWLDYLAGSVFDCLKRTQVRKENPPTLPVTRASRPWVQVPLDSLGPDGTKIEWYNLIGECVRPAPPGPGHPRPLLEIEITPLTLDVRQALAKLIDGSIGPWKGKISFHNLNDIPLCPACKIPDTTKPALS